MVEHRPTLIYDPIYLEHDTGPHPEQAARLERAMEALRQANLLDQLELVAPPPASLEAISAIHLPDYIRQVERLAQAGGGWLDPDTVVSHRSYEAAVYAAGGALKAIDTVFGQPGRAAFALVRPPGHHALPGRGMGFCLFNNIALAAHHALTQYGAQRVMIFDFDVHHGNGTQEIFYRDGRVLYVSTHQYPWYPGTGSLEEIGTGEGRGTTVNVPLPAGAGDAAFERICLQVLEPLARRFRPDVILVSAGYDAHWADNIALLNLSVTGFARIVSYVKSLAAELCAGRLVFTLEGGYHLGALAQSIVATFQVLLGQPTSDALGPSRSGEPGVQELLERVKSLHGLSS